jgi:hypothetical protein
MTLCQKPLSIQLKSPTNSTEYGTARPLPRHQVPGDTKEITQSYFSDEDKNCSRQSPNHSEVNAVTENGEKIKIKQFYGSLYKGSLFPHEKKSDILTHDSAHAICTINVVKMKLTKSVTIHLLQKCVTWISSPFREHVTIRFSQLLVTAKVLVIRYVACVSFMQSPLTSTKKVSGIKMDLCILHPDWRYRECGQLLLHFLLFPLTATPLSILEEKMLNFRTF